MVPVEPPPPPWGSSLACHPARLMEAAVPGLSRLTRLTAPRVTWSDCGVRCKAWGRVTNTSRVTGEGGGALPCVSLLTQDLQSLQVSAGPAARPHLKPRRRHANHACWSDCVISARHGGRRFKVDCGVLLVSQEEEGQGARALDRIVCSASASPSPPLPWRAQGSRSQGHGGGPLALLPKQVPSLS